MKDFIHAFSDLYQRFGIKCSQFILDFYRKVLYNTISTRDMRVLINLLDFILMIDGGDPNERTKTHPKIFGSHPNSPIFGIGTGTDAN